MRVLHLIDGLGGGGSERIVWDIVRLSPPAAARHTVLTVFADSPAFVYAPLLREVGAYRRSGAPVWLRRLDAWRASLPRGTPRRLLFAPVLFLHLCTFVVELVLTLREERPHVIHAHTFFGLLAGLLVSVACRLPLVHHVPATFEQLRDARVGWVIWCYRYLHHLIRAFFAGMPGELRAAGVPAEKIRHFRGAVDLKRIDEIRKHRDKARRDVRTSLDLPEDSLIALSVGRLHPSKGHHYAVDAVATLLPKFPQLHLLVLGEGDERERLSERAAQLAVTDHVHLLGFTLDPLQFYAAADVYLRTALIEGDNLSSFQAMAVGLPVVGFDTGVESDLLTQGDHGVLVLAGSSAALADGLARILDLPDRGASLGERGADHAAANLDLRRAVAAFLQTYRAVTGTQAPRPGEAGLVT